MSLTLATLLCAFLLLVAGGLTLLNLPLWREACRAFPRSEKAAFALMAVSSAWFLFHVSRLGEADFGNHRGLLFMGFATLAVLSFWYAREFLSVRAGCILYLLFAQVILGAAFMQEPGTRLFLVTPVYLGIVLALYLTLSPFRVRDFFTWLHGDDFRPRICGGAVAFYGIGLLLLPLTF